MKRESGSVSTSDTSRGIGHERDRAIDHTDKHLDDESGHNRPVRVELPDDLDASSRDTELLLRLAARPRPTAWRPSGGPRGLPEIPNRRGGAPSSQAAS